MGFELVLTLENLITKVFFCFVGDGGRGGGGFYHVEHFWVLEVCTSAS